MEKLEYLLNEYEPWIAKDGEHQENIRLYRAKSEDKIVRDNATRYIVSKEYKFIERLIKENKIDLNELVKLEMASGWDFEGEKVEREDNSREFYILFYTEVTLMLLSIQEKPIDVLISLLK